MIYDTAQITDLHGFCYQFDPALLGISVGQFLDPVSISQIVP